MGNNTGLYALTDEHEAIREAVRDIAEREIAPFAAEVDADSRYPIEAQKALTTAGFHATHIPEAYGGEGADAIATCIVIEEVARVDVSASLIPAVNKLGSVPLLLSASEELKQQVLPSIAAGDAMISYGLSEREAGSDADRMIGIEPSLFTAGMSEALQSTRATSSITMQVAIASAPSPP